jgi:cystathionine beta-lyase family protein involved in aluminum resistance
MLTYHLENALTDLRDLIAMTEADMEDIKLAQHDPQFERLALKDEKLKSFETKKAMIDHTIASLIELHPNTPLPELLNDEQHKLLEDLRIELIRLKEVNQKYAKMVLIVSNLYNEFLEQLVPTEMQGYNKVASKHPSILEVRV